MEGGKKNGDRGEGANGKDSFSQGKEVNGRCVCKITMSARNRGLGVRSSGDRVKNKIYKWEAVSYEWEGRFLSRKRPPS